MPLSKQEWEALVSNYDANSGSMRGYCLEKGIPYHSFLYWLKRLHGDVTCNQDQTKVSKPQFLPVRLKNHNLKTASQGRLRLEVKDITIVVSSEEFSQDLLLQTLSVIRSC